MGQLTFSDLEITPLSSDTAVVLGRWKLKRAQDWPHGRFTLIFRRLPEGWRIVHDHTSAAKE
jgi:ketosteroid isomerase-like protein